MKKLNLLPLEMKYDEIYQAVKKVTVLLAIIPVLYLMYLGFINIKTYKEIKEIKEVINEVASVEASIASTKQSIKKNQELHDNINVTEFPFTEFVKFISAKTPEDLSIISIDTEDKLIDIDIDTEKVVTNPELKPIDVISPGIEDDEDVDKVVTGTIVETIETVVDSVSGAVVGGSKIGETELGDIVVRGYSKNNVAIANFIYNISLLEFVEDVQLTAIEEKETTEGVANVFELVLNAK